MKITGIEVFKGVKILPLFGLAVANFKKLTFLITVIIKENSMIIKEFEDAKSDIVKKEHTIELLRNELSNEKIRSGKLAIEIMKKNRDIESFEKEVKDLSERLKKAKKYFILWKDEHEKIENIKNILS